MMEKIYKKAPLPFQGQKRAFLNKFIELIGELPDSSLVVDLFGGSGLLSHTVKRVKPSVRVIYNDYDNYCERLHNVSQTNNLLSKLRERMQGYTPEKALSVNLKSEIIQIIQKHEQIHGYIDYLTLSNSLLFSMRYVHNFCELVKCTFYNKIVSSEYVVDGYLDGLEIESQDYRAIFNKYKKETNVYFLLDPPYLSTDVSSYKNVSKYWHLSDYLDVLDLLTGVKYVYFSSEKSTIIELCQWLGDRYPTIKNPFKGSTVVKRKNSIPNRAEYQDIMVSNINTPAKIYH